MNANRANAQKSTGPRTEEGKAHSRLNSLKHGAYVVEASIAGIDAQVFIDREKRYFDHYQPKTPAEIFHVKAMIAAENEHDMCVALRPFTLRAVLDSQPEDARNPIGEGVVEDAKKTNALEKLARRTKQAYQIWVRSEKALIRIQTEKTQVDIFMDQAATGVPMEPNEAAE
jgi:hypothetical protein